MSIDSKSILAPFQHRIFILIWCAGLISNIGTWIFNVTSSWLMTELSHSALMVSLVQAATALPIVLFALPAGALGDIFDRRKLLIFCLILLTVILFIFAAFLHANLINDWLLLFFTFLIGIATAFFAPTWQAIVPYLVQKDELQSAIALNGISMNFARAVGPAVGGLILAAFGAVLAVVLDAISYLFIVLALLWWRTTVIKSDLPRERLFGAMKSGLQFALLSESLRATLYRTFFFILFSCAFWALLPLIAKEVYGGGPSFYGILLSGIGVGAVLGALLLPLFRHRLKADALVLLGTLLTALALSLFALGNHKGFGICGSIIAGISWLCVLSSLNVSAQLALPDWVRARGLAIFQVVLFGSMMLGSIIWGQLAVTLGLKWSLTVNAILALACIPLTRRWQLNLSEEEDYTPSHHWPVLQSKTPISPHQGPVLVMIEYQVALENKALFEERMTALGVLRKRDGARYWGFFEDIEKEGHYIETFIDESWVAHLRKHERVSQADKKVQEKILSLHEGESPKITHAIAPLSLKPRKKGLKKH
jgi:MFS family permease